jgi:hypothetical protein
MRSSSLGQRDVIVAIDQIAAKERLQRNNHKMILPKKHKPHKM